MKKTRAPVTTPSAHKNFSRSKKAMARELFNLFNHSVFGDQVCLCIYTNNNIVYDSIALCVSNGRHTLGAGVCSQAEWHSGSVLGP